MFVLRIIRDFAMLAILAVAVLVSTPPTASAQVCIYSIFRCSGYTTGCQFCCPLCRCVISCYDRLFHRYCCKTF
jgi:hypothetical protein